MHCPQALPCLFMCQTLSKCRKVFSSLCTCITVTYPRPFPCILDSQNIFHAVYMIRARHLSTVVRHFIPRYLTMHYPRAISVTFSRLIQPEKCLIYYVHFQHVQYYPLSMYLTAHYALATPYNTLCTCTLCISTIY